MLLVTKFVNAGFFCRRTVRWVELLRCPGMINNLVCVTVVGTAGSSWFSAFLEIHLGAVVRQRRHNTLIFSYGSLSGFATAN
jgi:hypothetical protein